MTSCAFWFSWCHLVKFLGVQGKNLACMGLCGLTPDAPKLFQGGGREHNGRRHSAQAGRRALAPKRLLFCRGFRGEKSGVYSGFCRVLQGDIKRRSGEPNGRRNVRLHEPHPACESAAVKFLSGVRSWGRRTVAANGGSALHTLHAVARVGSPVLFPEYPTARQITRRAGYFLYAPLYSYTWLQA